MLSPIISNVRWNLLTMNWLTPTSESFCPLKGWGICPLTGYTKEAKMFAGMGPWTLAHTSSLRNSNPNPLSNLSLCSWANNFATMWPSYSFVKWVNYRVLEVVYNDWQLLALLSLLGKHPFSQYSSAQKCFELPVLAYLLRSLCPLLG